MKTECNLNRNLNSQGKLSWPKAAWTDWVPPLHERSRRNRSVQSVGCHLSVTFRANGVFVAPVSINNSTEINAFTAD